MTRRLSALVAALAVAASLAVPVVNAVAGPRDGGIGRIERAPAQKVLLLGSSTTACTGPPVGKCYVDHVRAARPDAVVSVVARGGTLVDQWRDAVLPAGQTTVVIQLGVNDAWVPVEPALLARSVLAVIARVREGSPTANIAYLRAWRPTAAPADDDVRREMWTRQRDAVATAVLGAGAVYLDVDPFGTWGTPYRADATGWHYNAAGHEQLASMALSIIGVCPTAVRR